MTADPSTYCAELYRAICDGKAIHCMSDAALMSLLSTLESCIKFALPDNGRCLNLSLDELRACSLSEQVRLPYPSMAICYFSQRSINSGDDPSSSFYYDDKGKRHSFERISQTYGFDAVPQRILLLQQMEGSGQEFAIQGAFKYQKGGWSIYPAQTRYTLPDLNTVTMFSDPTLFSHNSIKARQETILADYADEISCVKEFLMALECSNVEISPLPDLSRLKKQRLKSKRLKIFQHKTLSIKPRADNSKGNSGGTHSSPRVHLRRGHIRWLSNGKKIWINPMVVGDKSKGIISKDYKLKRSDK